MPEAVNIVKSLAAKHGYRPAFEFDDYCNWFTDGNGIGPSHILSAIETAPNKQLIYSLLNSSIQCNKESKNIYKIASELSNAIMENCSDFYIRMQDFPQKAQEWAEKLKGKSEEELKKIFQRCLTIINENSGKYDIENNRKLIVSIIYYLHEPYLEKVLLSIFEGSDYWHTRCCVLETLSKLNTPHFFEILVKAASDESEYVRRDVAIFLGNTKSKLTKETLLKLFSDKNYSVRFSALDSLIKIGITPSLETVYKSLDSPDEYEVRAAADALGKIATPYAKKLLCKKLEAGDVKTLEEIIEAAGKYKIKEAIKPLIRIIKNPPSDGFFHDYSLEALVKIDPSVAKQKLVRIIKNYYNGNYTLGRWSFGIDHLIRLFIKGCNYEKHEVLEIIGYLKSDHDQKVAYECLCSSSPQIILQEASMLWHKQSSVDWWKDWGKAILIEAIENTGIYPKDNLLLEEMESFANEKLVSKEVNDRVFAIRILGCIHSEEAESLLMDALEDKVEEVKIAARASLVKVGTSSTIERLKERIDRNVPHLSLYLMATINDLKNKLLGE